MKQHSAGMLKRAIDQANAELGESAPSLDLIKRAQEIVEEQLKEPDDPLERSSVKSLEDAAVGSLESAAGHGMAFIGSVPAWMVAWLFKEVRQLRAELKALKGD